jgi:hypothetical protein
LSLLKKIQERIIPIQTPGSVQLFQQSEEVRHEFVNFSGAYRIGMLCYFEDLESQDIIEKYKQRLEKLGYDCEALIFSDKKERDHTITLPSFNWEDLERRSMLPHSPRTDRFMMKRFDLLLNLYLKHCPPLQFISSMSYARCRIAPFLEHFKACADVLIPLDTNDTIDGLILKLNNTLHLKPYERKQI